MERLRTMRYPCALSLFHVVCLVAFSIVAAPANAQPAVAAGGSHSLILKADGTVWSVGQNNWGQLGNDSITNSEVPVQVVGLSNIVAIAAGGTHSIALTAGKTVYVWGWNGVKQLGDSSTSYYETTPKLLSLTGVIAIAAGEYHSLALTETGGLYAWGGNASGQLGDASNTNSSVVLQIATGVAAIGAGDHCLIQENDGTTREVSSDGTVEETNALPAPGIFAFGRFHARDSANTLKALAWKPVNDLTSYISLSAGAFQSAPDPFGLFVKTHMVAESVSQAMHAALRLVPRRQRDWQATSHAYSQYFRVPPAYYGDLYYATVGAGTNISSCNLGTLTSGINRDRDFKVFPVHHARISVALADEDTKMLAALDAARDFQNGELEYYCWPEPGDEKYNSNGFLHGLLIKVQLPVPTGIAFTPTLFPGWSKPVPSPYYSPPQ